MSEATTSMVPTSTPQDSAVLQQTAQNLVKDLPKIATKPTDTTPINEETPKNGEKLEEIDYSSRFAALSRREKQLLEREKRLKDVESKLKDAESFKTSWETKKMEMKKNPDLIFEEIGMSFDDVINFKLGIKKEAEEKNLDPNELYKKIKQDLELELENKLKSREEEQLKLQQEQEEQQNAQIIENYKQEIVNTLKSQADKYELINYQGNYDLVYDVIESYFNEHNEVLPLDQAADHVEAYLESLVEGATKLKKFQSKFAPKVEQPTQSTKAPETKMAEEKEPSAPKTLSNTLQSSSGYNYSNAVVDVEESKRRAAALLRWK